MPAYGFKIEVIFILQIAFIFEIVFKNGSNFVRLFVFEQDLKVEQYPFLDSADIGCAG